jgi:hypothetical protein
MTETVARSWGDGFEEEAKKRRNFFGGWRRVA